MEATPHWLDQQYNPFVSVPEVAALFQTWEARSAQVRTELSCQLDLAYGEGQLETLDIFPAAESGSPVLVFIHGGYWRGSDKQSYHFLAPSFVKQGVTVVLLNYALCPAVSIGTICGQINQALAWLGLNLAKYGADPNKLVLAGHSAGAHLAAMALLARPEQVRKALCISGLFDLSPLREAPFIRDDLKLDETDVRELSPAFAPAPQGATIMAAVGELETAAFHQQSQHLQAKWGRTVVPVLDSIAQSNHFDVLETLADDTGLLRSRAASLLFA